MVPAHPALPLTCLTLRLSSRGLLSAVYAASSTVLMLEVVAVDSTVDRYLGRARGHPGRWQAVWWWAYPSKWQVVWQFGRRILVKLMTVGQTLTPPGLHLPL